MARRSRDHSSVRLKIAEVAGERVKLEANGVGGEGAARRSRARRRARPDCGKKSLSGRNERYYRSTNAALSDIIACEDDHPDAGCRQRSRCPSRDAREQVEVGLHRYAMTGQGDVKALQGRGGYQLRIGGYRVIFDEDASTILAVYYRPPGHDDLQEELRL